MGIEYESLTDQSLEASDPYKAERDADPLNADPLFRALPSINKIIEETRDPSLLVQGVRSLLDANSSSQLNVLPLAQARAATRDLGMLRDNVRRHRVDPGSIAGLDEALAILKESTGEGYSFWHYSNYNSQDERQRLFTGHPLEILFVQKITEANIGWETGAKFLSAAREVPIVDTAFEQNLTKARYSLLMGVKAMGAVATEITPQFFTEEIVPYFPNPSASAAHASLLVVSRINWGLGKRKDPIYEEFYAENIEFLPKHLKEKAYLMEGRSLVEKLDQEVRSNSSRVSELVPAVAAMRDVILTEVSFSRPHHSVVKQSMKFRQGEVGGAGYGSDMTLRLTNYRDEAYETVDGWHTFLKWLENNSADVSLFNKR